MTFLVIGVKPERSAPHHPSPGKKKQEKYIQNLDISINASSVYIEMLTII